MPVLRKRKGSREMSPSYKRRKGCYEVADTRKKISLNSNSEIKVENEFNNLFEEEADLMIKGEELDIFNEDFENLDIDSSSKAEYLLYVNQEVSASVSNTKNKSSCLKNSATVAQIINDQKEALKLIRTALMKFESVTKGLQEMVEYDIEEAQSDMESAMNSVIDSLQITSVEGQSCIFEDSIAGSSASHPNQDEVMSINEESVSPATLASSVQNQPKYLNNKSISTDVSQESIKCTSGSTFNEHSSSTNHPVEDEVVSANEESILSVTQANLVQKQPKKYCIINPIANEFHHENEKRTSDSTCNQNCTVTASQAQGDKVERITGDCCSKQKVSSTVSNETDPSTSSFKKSLSGPKIQNLRKEKRREAEKLPYVVLNDIMDKKSPLLSSIKPCGGDNGASNFLPENFDGTVVSSLNENHRVSLCSQVENSQPSSSQGAATTSQPRGDKVNHEPDSSTTSFKKKNISDFTIDVDAFTNSLVKIMKYDQQNFPSYAENIEPSLENEKEASQDAILPGTSKEMLVEESHQICQSREETIVHPLGSSPTKRKRVGKKRVKPLRPCLYCHGMYTKVTQHIKNAHAEETDVRKIISLPKKEYDEEMLKLIKRGIYNHNLLLLKNKQTNFMMMRKQKEDNGVAICNKCFGTYSNSFFFFAQKKV